MSNQLEIDQLNWAKLQKKSFDKISKTLFKKLNKTEEINLSLVSESTIFVRFNQAKDRQNTSVEQGVITFNYQKEGKAQQFSFPLSGNEKIDIKYATEALEKCRFDSQSLLEDPFLTPFSNNGESYEQHKGNLPEVSDIFKDVLGAMGNIDKAGIFTSGKVIRANQNSKGQNHWFESDSFYIDYSIFTPNQKALKGTYSGDIWSSTDYKNKINEAKSTVDMLSKQTMNIKKGKYKTYLAPAAVAELFGTIGWDGLSYNSYKKGNCGLRKLFDREVQLSEKVTLTENFELGLVPRFNSLGELSKMQVELIKDGIGVSPLVSTRSSKEYGVNANGADKSEFPRSLELKIGNLKQEDILRELGTGLYISNLHYLNWSDVQAGRITGMTRYACFWVENGEIVAPINDLRFDETVFNMFGKGLIDLTDFSEYIPTVQSYEQRDIGGAKVPGMMIKDFSFTL